MSTPFVPAPRVCRYVLTNESNGREWSIVLECGKVSEWPDGGGAMEETALAINEWADTNLGTVLSTSCQTLTLTGQRMQAYAEPIYEFSVGFPVAGDVAGGALPNNVCVVMHKSTGATGRSRSGRTYMSGVPVASRAGADANNEITSGALDDYEAVGGALLSAISGVDDGLQLAVVRGVRQR